MNSKLVRIIAPHFVCGILVSKDIVVDAAPIMAWSINKNAPWVRQWCARKRYEWEPIE